MFFTLTNPNQAAQTENSMETTEQETPCNFSIANVRSLVRKGFATNRLLMFVGLSMVVAFFGTLVAAVADPLVITGVPAWLKPAKFAISISIYSFTFLWLLSFIQGHSRLKKVVATVTGIGFLFEMAVIVLQVIRGTTSHFNIATGLDAVLFQSMGGVIVTVWISGIVTAVMLVRQRISDPAFAWALRFGIILAVVGMGVAFLMTIPTGQQLADAQSGLKLTVLGAHTVGIPDGGPGLPFLGWSTVGGDLRIPHFIGLHAMQVLPLFGWLLARSRFEALRTGHRVALVWTAGLSYLGLIGLLTWQALRGQSIISPDALTLEAAATLISVTALAVISIVAHARLVPENRSRVAANNL